MAKPSNNKRRRYAAPIGGAFILLAFVGLVAVVLTSLNLTDRLLGNEADKERIEDVIRPLLMWDPPPFEDPADISPALMLHASMWSALGYTSYPFNENQEMEVPASDLDVAATRLFGPGVTLQHRTFGEYEQSYYFDRVRQVYHVAATAQLFRHSPRVISIERGEGAYYDVLVGYLPPQGAFTANLQGARGIPEPEKYMIYVMRRTGDSFQIVALRDTPAAVGEMYMPG
ncbi:MAG: hypothetical protein FWE19_00725 [Oscillospiraceae bacterium]|nr:hypothetical protein [Oscillospiraceae bacterium]